VDKSQAQSQESLSPEQRQQLVESGMLQMVQLAAKALQQNSAQSKPKQS
jgi:hypothetical protein